MKNLITLVFAMFAYTICTFAQNPNHVYVNGYTRSNGTYVQGYYKTAPNNTINDNFTTYPNVNPYTGTQGTVASSHSNTYTPSSYSNSYSTTYTNTYVPTTYTPTSTYISTTYRNW